MKNFPFKILFICIFLPPVFYIMTINALNGYFKSREIIKINQILIKSHDALLEGRYTVKEEISRNLGEYLGHSLRYKLGISTRVLVKTRDERILYPTQFRRDFDNPTEEGEFSQIPLESINYMEVAAENYRTLNQGLVLSVDVEIKHNTWLANAILIFYVFLALLVLRGFIRKGFRESEREERERQQLIAKFSQDLKMAESRLREVDAKESGYLKKIGELKKGKQDLSKDVEGLLEEMEELEAGLKEQRRLKEDMELTVLQLTEELDRVREKLAKPRHKKKREVARKRLRVLYKNLAFTDRAVDGFLSLTDEFQVKAEEMIHRLNEDESQISVKRKVFGKGGKLNVLEADFSYSGRIYFRKDSQSKIQIVAIGTKNTQEKDLAFLEGIH